MPEIEPNERHDLRQRRSQIRDEAIPLALARLGREGIAAKVPAPGKQPLATELQEIDERLAELSRERTMDDAQRDEFEVLRRKRRAGYAEIGEAILKQLPSQAQTKAFEDAVRHCKTLIKELNALSDALNQPEGKSSKRPAPKPAAAQQKREEKRPATIPHRSDPVIPMAASPPVASSPFNAPRLPDIGDPLDLRYPVEVPPLHRRIQYTATAVWDWFASFQVAITWTVTAVLLVILIYPGVRAAFDRTQTIAEPSLASTESGAAGSSTEAEAAASGRRVDGLGGVHAVLFALLVGTAIFHWRGLPIGFTSRSARPWNSHDDRGATLVDYDPMAVPERYRAKLEHTVRLHPTGPDEEMEAETMYRKPVVSRVALTGMLLLNVFAFGFYRVTEPDASAMTTIADETIADQAQEEEQKSVEEDQHEQARNAKRAMAESEFVEAAGESSGANQNWRALIAAVLAGGAGVGLLFPKSGHSGSSTSRPWGQFAPIAERLAGILLVAGGVLLGVGAVRPAMISPVPGTSGTDLEDTAAKTLASEPHMMARPTWAEFHRPAGFPKSQHITGLDRFVMLAPQGRLRLIGAEGTVEARVRMYIAPADRYLCSQDLMAQTPAAILRLVTNNASDLRAYHDGVSAWAWYGGAAIRMEGRPTYVVTVFPVGGGHERDNLLRAEPGSVRQIEALTERFGPRHERQYWSQHARAASQIGDEVSWWGTTGFAADNSGRITHVLIRSVMPRRP